MVSDLISCFLRHSRGGGNPDSNFLMLKSNLKLIIIAGIIFIIVITVIIVISFTKKSTISTPNSPKQNVVSPTPNYQLPSPIPLLDFTGADHTQTLPPEIQSVGEQKTALRRLTPLFLDFAVVEFDYENDVFLVQLLDPIDVSRIQFSTWKTQTYPALLDNQFIIY